VQLGLILGRLLANHVEDMLQDLGEITRGDLRERRNSCVRQRAELAVWRDKNSMVTVVVVEQSELLVAARFVSIGSPLVFDSLESLLALALGVRPNPLPFHPDPAGLCAIIFDQLTKPGMLQRLPGGDALFRIVDEDLPE
jgi:hypothetical protein